MQNTLAANWRHSKAGRAWRAAIIARDGKCLVCLSRKKLQAHHLADASHHPVLCFELSNGACLCYNCHKLLHTSINRSYRDRCYPWQVESLQELYTAWVG